MSTRQTYRDVGVVAVLRSHCVQLSVVSEPKCNAMNPQIPILCCHAMDIVQTTRQVAVWGEQQTGKSRRIAVMREKRQDIAAAV